MTTTITITWHQPDMRPMGREDSAWYTYFTHDLVASVSNGERTIRIHADGEMRVHIAYSPLDWAQGHSVIRYCDQWEQWEINNDNDIYESAEIGRIEWISNSWFDLYAEGQDWFDSVQHTLSDAIESAHELLADDTAWIK